MPWVRLDDRFPSHRKVALLSDRAFRLYVSALCWCSENLTEGKILDRELAVVARVRNTKAAAKELEDANLWDRVDDGWEIHDFLEYNPDRAKVKAGREANAARQQAFRDRKKAEREAKKAAAQTPKTDERNGVTGPSRNGGSNSTPYPSPSPFSPYGENGAPTTPPQQERAAAFPDRLIDLKRAIAAAGIAGIEWRLRASQWEYARQAVERVGIDAMVAYAARSVQLKGTPTGASAWIDGWRSLEAPPENGVTYLPAAVNGLPPQPSRTDQKFAAGLALAARLEAEDNR
jgi:hypothetical protein